MKMKWHEKLFALAVLAFLMFQISRIFIDYPYIFW